MDPILDNCRYDGHDCYEIVGACSWEYLKWEPKEEKDCNTCENREEDPVYCQMICEDINDPTGWEPIEDSLPACLNALHKASPKLAIPPRKGYAGLRIRFFKIYDIR